MNIVEKIDHVTIDNVFFQDEVKNTMMEEAQFIRILYALPYVTLTGLYLHVPPLHTPTFERAFNKFKCTFDVTQSDHVGIAHSISALEAEILQKARQLFPSKLQRKTMVCKLHEQLQLGCIKVCNEPKPQQQLVLKIFGIWETQHAYGLTFKFVYHAPSPIKG
jgi:hypothetical protein